MTALFLLLQWMSADGLGRARDVIARQEAPAAWDFLLTNVHLFVGGLLLLLTVWRIRLRLSDPEPIAPGSRLQQFAATLVHWALLVVLLLLPITGALSYYQLLSTAGWWHEIAGWVLLGLMILHLLGVIWHSLRGDAIWRRMVSPRAGVPESERAD